MFILNCYSNTHHPFCMLTARYKTDTLKSLGKQRDKNEPWDMQGAELTAAHWCTSPFPDGCLRFLSPQAWFSPSTSLHLDATHKTESQIMSPGENLISSHHGVTLSQKMCFTVSYISADLERRLDFNSCNSCGAELMCVSMMWVCLCSVVISAQLDVFLFAVMLVLRRVSGRGLSCSAYWRDGMILKHMVPTEKVNTALPLNISGESTLLFILFYHHFSCYFLPISE